MDPLISGNVDSSTIMTLLYNQIQTPQGLFKDHLFLTICLLINVMYSQHAKLFCFLSEVGGIHSYKETWWGTHNE